jgi:predicted nucleic acid-binding protein
MMFILDTNVVSELRKARSGKANSNVVRWRVSVDTIPSVPQTRPWADAFIAATALVHGMTVITRNIGDFESTGAKVFNPWA